MEQSRIDLTQAEWQVMECLWVKVLHGCRQLVP